MKIELSHVHSYFQVFLSWSRSAVRRVKQFTEMVHGADPLDPKLHTCLASANNPNEDKL